MSSLLAVGLLVAGLVLVVSGAELFFDGLLSAAVRFGIAPFALTVLLSGLELENLAAGIATNARGLSAAAAGTFLGGTTFIALAVAGVSGLLVPFAARVPVGLLAWTAASPLPLVALSVDGRLSRLDGGLLLAWFALVLVGLLRAGRGLVAGEAPERKRWWALRLAAGIALLTGGGEALGQGIERTVSRFGISQALLGNTAVAAAVEAEEIGRVAVPARHGRGDVALGNLLGTIAHFVALNAGVIALVRPIDVHGATREVHLPAAAGSVLVLGAVVAARRGLGRLAGAALLALYGGYVAAAVILR